MRIESRARRYRLPRLPDWLRELLAEAPALPSQLLAVGVLLVMVASEAGYGDTNWPPAALLLLGLLVVTAFVVGAPAAARGAPARRAWRCSPATRPGASSRSPGRAWRPTPGRPPTARAATSS